jgi:4-hydroxybenzoate polyprenyltransferase
MRGIRPHSHARVPEALSAGPFTQVSDALPARRSTVATLWKLYRVRDWLHFLPLPLAGWTAAGDGVPALLGGVVGWACGLAYTCAINQAFDDRLDRANVGKNPVGGTLRRREAVLLSVPPAVAMLSIVAWLSPAGLLPASILLVVATLYSAPPRLKRIPGLATLWNVVIGLPGLFFAGTPQLAAGPARLLGGLFAILLLVSQLIHEAKDRDDDQAGGIPTIATLGGMSGALGAGVLVLLVLPALTWWLANGFALRAALTAASAVFALGWVVALMLRIVRGDEANLRATRLRYRHTSLALGALAFLATLLR